MHKTFMWPLFLIVVLLAGVFISACSSQPEPVLRVGSLVWPGYEPLYLARDLGYYRDSRIRLVELGSASDVIHALRNGTLEAATLTLDEALSMLQDGVHLKIILVMDTSHGGDALLVRPGIESLAELRGKSIAVENTAVGAVLLDGALQAAGLTAADITIVACVLDEHIDCYQKSDAVVTFDPVRTILLRQGAIQLFDSSQIPDRIVDVMVVLEAVIQKNPVTLKRLLGGYFEARKYLDENPQDAAERMAPRMGLSSKEVLTSFSGLKFPMLRDNYHLLNDDSPAIENIADRLAKFMLDDSLLRHEIEVGGIADDRFLPGKQP